MKPKFKVIINKQFPRNMFLNPGIWSPEQRAWCYRNASGVKLRPEYLWVVPKETVKV